MPLSGHSVTSLVLLQPQLLLLLQLLGVRYLGSRCVRRERRARSRGSGREQRRENHEKNDEDCNYCNYYNNEEDWNTRAPIWRSDWAVLKKRERGMSIYGNNGWIVLSARWVHRRWLRNEVGRGQASEQCSTRIKVQCMTSYTQANERWLENEWWLETPSHSFSSQNEWTSSYQTLYWNLQC